MAKYSNQEIISQIQNGNEEILFYLARRYFTVYRRWLRRKGIPDAETPVFFTNVFTRICNEIRTNSVSVHVDFDNYLSGSMREALELRKSEKKDTDSNGPLQRPEKEAVAQCLNILDDQARKLLLARYYLKQNFEQIAANFEFSNPVIAEFEVNKALNRLEGMVRYRLNTNP